MNNIEPKYVTFEQAKCLEKIGFNIQEYLKIDDENPLNLNSNFNPREYQPWYLDLNQWEVCEWLRVNHGIWTIADYYNNGDKNIWFWNIKFNSKETMDGGFNSPQEAYSAAFDYIKDNNLI
jgi:hypothetical protein